MGLISRVSSRTYRSLNFLKKNKTWLISVRTEVSKNRRPSSSSRTSLTNPSPSDTSNPLVSESKPQKMPIHRQRLHSRPTFNRSRYQVEDAEVLHRPTRLPSLHQEVPTIRKTTQDGLRPRFSMLARYCHRRFSHHR